MADGDNADSGIKMSNILFILITPRRLKSIALTTQAD